MGKTQKQSRRPDAAAPPGPRRLGGQSAPSASSGAARRSARRNTRRSSRKGWLAIGLVVVVVVVFVVIKVTSNSPSNTANSSSGVTSGRTPKAAPAALVADVTTIPASVFESIGTGGQPVPFVVTAKQTPLISGGLPSFVYEGAEYCPYCAMMRWSMIAALSRFGTFSGLKVTSSAVSDEDIPTFSFLGSHYSSPYLSFSPYEFQDRNRNALQSVPAAAAKLETKYGYPPFTPTAAQGGIPFLDIANRYIVSGTPQYFLNLIPLLQNGGPGQAAIGAAIHDPSSSIGQALQAKDFIIEANYMSAAICSVDGAKPAAVCTSPAVTSAMHALAKSTPVS